MRKASKKPKFLLEFLPYLFFLLAFVMILRVVVSLNSAEPPDLFGYSAAVVVSPSMEDTIMTGDLIFIKTVDPDTLQEGDIITFWQPDAEKPVTITHRIIEIAETPDGRIFTTKGDHNNASLDWEIGFSEDQIIGKYVSKSAFLGRIYVWFVSAGVGIIYLFVIILFLSIALVEMKNIIRELAANKKKQLEEERAKLVAIEVERLRNEPDAAKTKE